MNKITLLFILAIFFVLISCDEDAIPVPITFVFDQPLSEGKYPDYFKQITEPFSASQCDKDHLLKPISAARIDIKKTPIETNAWYFEQMGDNTVEFSKNWLSQYYNDSLVPNYLTLPSKREVNDQAIDSYFGKEDMLTLIYSEESDKEMYNEAAIYSNYKEITSKIREGLCNKAYKEIVVIVDPKILTNKGGAIRPPGGDPCIASTVTDGLDLKEDLLSIIDTQKSYNERDVQAKATWSKYFDEMASIKMYLKPEQKFPEGTWESGDGQNYLIDRLAYMNSITDVNITRIEYHRETKKITGIVIVECHNASQIQ